MLLMKLLRQTPPLETDWDEGTIKIMEHYVASRRPYSIFGFATKHYTTVIVRYSKIGYTFGPGQLITTCSAYNDG